MESEKNCIQNQKHGAYDFTGESNMYEGVVLLQPR